MVFGVTSCHMVGLGSGALYQRIRLWYAKFLCICPNSLVFLPPIFIFSPDSEYAKFSGLAPSYMVGLGDGALYQGIGLLYAKFLCICPNSLVFLPPIFIFSPDSEYAKFSGLAPSYMVGLGDGALYQGIGLLYAEFLCIRPIRPVSLPFFFYFFP